MLHASLRTVGSSSKLRGFPVSNSYTASSCVKPNPLLNTNNICTPEIGLKIKEAIKDNKLVHNPWCWSLEKDALHQLIIATSPQIKYEKTNWTTVFPSQGLLFTHLGLELGAQLKGHDCKPRTTFIINYCIPFSSYCTQKAFKLHIKKYVWGSLGRYRKYQIPHAISDGFVRRKPWEFNMTNWNHPMSPCKQNWFQLGWLPSDWYMCFFLSGTVLNGQENVMKNMLLDCWMDGRSSFQASSA